MSIPMQALTRQVLGASDGRPADEDDLHGQQQSEHVVGAVGHVEPVRVAAGHQQTQHVRGDEAFIVTAKRVAARGECTNQ